MLKAYAGYISPYFWFLAHAAVSSDAIQPAYALYGAFDYALILAMMELVFWVVRIMLCRREAVGPLSLLFPSLEIPIASAFFPLLIGASVHFLSFRIPPTYVTMFSAWKVGVGVALVIVVVMATAAAWRLVCALRRLSVDDFRLYTWHAAMLPKDSVRRRPLLALSFGNPVGSWEQTRHFLRWGTSYSVLRPTGRYFLLAELMLNVVVVTLMSIRVRDSGTGPCCAIYSVATAVHAAFTVLVLLLNRRIFNRTADRLLYMAMVMLNLFLSAFFTAKVCGAGIHAAADVVSVVVAIGLGVCNVLRFSMILFQKFCQRPLTRVTIRSAIALPLTVIVGAGGDAGLEYKPQLMQEVKKSTWGLTTTQQGCDLMRMSPVPPPLVTRTTSILPRGALLQNTLMKPLLQGDYDHHLFTRTASGLLAVGGEPPRRGSPMTGGGLPQSNSTNDSLRVRQAHGARHAVADDVFGALGEEMRVIRPCATHSEQPPMMSTGIVQPPAMLSTQRGHRAAHPVDVVDGTICRADAGELVVPRAQLNGAGRAVDAGTESTKAARKREHQSYWGLVHDIHHRPLVSERSTMGSIGGDSTVAQLSVGIGSSISDGKLCDGNENTTRATRDPHGSLPAGKRVPTSNALLKCTGTTPIANGRGPHQSRGLVVQAPSAVSDQHLPFLLTSTLRKVPVTRSPGVVA